MGQLYRSTDKITWDRYQLSETDLKEIRKLIPAYGEVEQRTGKQREAVMRPTESRLKKRYVSRGMKEGKGHMRPDKPRIGIPLVATEQVSGVEKVYWRYCDEDKLPEVVAKSAVLSSLRFKQSNKNYQMGKRFFFPGDNEELFFLLKFSPLIQTTDTNKVVTKPVYYFDVPEIALTRRGEGAKQAMAVYSWLESLDTTTLNEVFSALGFVGDDYDNDAKVQQLWEFCSEGKNKDAVMRLRNVASSRKNRAQLMLVSSLLESGQLIKAENGWFSNTELNQKGDKAKPLAGPCTDEEFCEKATKDIKLSATLMQLKKLAEASAATV